MKDSPNLLARLGVALPIIQAPMAGVGTPALAAAVSNAGALGSLGVGAMNAQSARAAIHELRALTSKPFNVNVFVHAPAVADPIREARWLDYLAPHFARFGAKPPTALSEIYTSFVEDDAMLAMLIDERPAVVSFHFGLPSAAKIAALREAGIMLLASATSLDEAAQIHAAGLDGVVAQGAEAGGHRGNFDPSAPDELLGTMALVRRFVREIPLPVIAAGGIMDGAGIAAALALGAQAVQLGTAFVASPESAADAAYRAALLSPDSRTTFISAISGRAARGIKNRLSELGDDPGRPALPDYPIAYDAGKALHAAAKVQGSAAYAAQWAGQAVRLSRAMPAAELVETLVREVREAQTGTI
ncbi:Nitronate monooxygenase [Paraburkholderia domus]|uniref:NAD(P)H-dependent flavin oxidoreductase n=1 Tax=Paraburkholderia domus TaxID=2793075 RepID=UPI001913CF9B|nr:nitronate monooxygenase family protein [Paraburkholderia domus]MBK5087155.1 nitronate monooxygenase [Burkholderia sp. R-69927]MBK5123511.1 nitronate monooxygenase [Burkholderia sp. R-69980]MBK5180909.1 nitronate monooxygenase [Burkholderia sp. R-69749]MCI0148320.1 nitronate monooxygenase [Paraburkholderia sediminicola]CAE6734066.1 Nitronate monooxygenase [Paraburkholderia domus]